LAAVLADTNITADKKQPVIKALAAVLADTNITADKKQPLITAIVNSGATPEQLNTIFTEGVLREGSAQTALAAVLADTNITADKKQPVIKALAAVLADTNITVDKKQPVIKAIATNCQDITQLKDIFTQEALSDPEIQKTLADAIIKKLEDTNEKEKALIALITIADHTLLQKTFKEKDFLSCYRQEFSNIINNENIGNPLKRKTIQALHKIKVDDNQEKIAKIMKEALDVKDNYTKNEAIIFFREYHKKENKDFDENLITDLVGTTKIEQDFKKGLYVDKTKMSILNTLLKKFDNQETIDGCLEKAEEYLQLMGHNDFDKRKPNLDLLSKVPNNIKELTKKGSYQSALDSIKTVVGDIKDDEQKKFVLELFFGKPNPLAPRNIPATIGVNDIEKFNNIYQNNLTTILSEIDYKDQDSVNFYKEYIKADFINRIPNKEKPGGGLVSWNSWGYSGSYFDRGNWKLPKNHLPSTTKQNNNAFLEDIILKIKDANFQGTSNRQKDGILCDNNAIKQIVQEYAACSSESSKREYRQAFYQVLSDLKCVGDTETKKDWSRKINTIKLNDTLNISCSQDQLHLLVHAKIANFRYGYSQNELAEIINKTKPERLTSEINNYCEKYQKSLLNRKEENLNILCIKTSSSDSIGILAGGLGGATRYVLNSLVFCNLRRLANSANYYIPPSPPSFSIAQPDGCILVNPKEVKKQ
jgi:hypothetical protein